MPPLVTIIIPTYNYAHYLSQAIDSALAQTYPNIEVIVVDDGSTDDTSEAIKPYLDQVRYHYKKNAGLSAARNTGLDLAKGEYIQLLDADDLLSPDTVNYGVRALQDNRTASAAVYSNELFYQNPGDHPKALHWKLPSGARLDHLLFFRNLAPPHCFLTKKEYCGQIDPFDTSLKACEDYDYWFRYFSTFGEPVRCEGHVYYRRHPNSMSANLKQQYLYDHIVTVRIFDRLCKALRDEKNLFGKKCTPKEAYGYHVALIAASLVNLRNNAKVGHSNQTELETFCGDLLRATIDHRPKLNSKQLAALAPFWYPIKRYATKFFPEFKTAIEIPSLTQLKLSQHPEFKSISISKLLTADIRWGVNKKPS